ncbi:MAG: amino acid ABC transporter permease [Thermoleophilia bacterium]
MPAPDPLDDPFGRTGRRSRILAGTWRREGARGVAVALVSTVVVCVVLGILIVNAPGWPRVREFFFNWGELEDSMPQIAEKFLVNVEAFAIAEAVVLVLGLGIAILRSLPGPVFFPIRALAILWVDVFRGMPTILVIALLVFGVPALEFEGVPIDPLFWGIVAIVLVYSAYVAEVYRAGIESVHPSQDAAARSLGLSRLGSLRHVVVPQAVRRVVPPLLNDFIGLQKDTALLGVGGAVEAFRQAQIDQAAAYNMTPFVALALVFIAITIPLTRFTDWLVARERGRRQATGLL